MTLRVRVYDSLAAIEPARWDSLLGAGTPFLSHAFLGALEDSGSVGVAVGWQPAHLVLEQAQEVAVIVPMYVKSHSYGEFVFDWSWAEAYRRNGLEYYPKLVCAAPFSPVAGPRIGLAEGVDPVQALPAVFEGIRDFADRTGASGWHMLFPDRSTQAALARSDLAEALLRREDVQFHWRNQGFADFDGFLATLRASRRKNIRRERRRVDAAGVRMQRLTGADIGMADWEGFYACYRSTYEKRSGHAGYLNREFFDALLERMRDRLLLVTARREKELVGSALFLFDRKRLYGRYWGALEAIDCLHFETCFYQGIEFCIERGLEWFDPGTQGEHKLMRGFEPVRTASYHWLADQRFHRALCGALEMERRHIDAYEESARAYLPFRRDA